jgi:serine/threonine protein kinase
MAHYIAEQITTAENSTGKEKSEAELRCFDTILKIWQHRAFLPSGRRPFEGFESIFHALEKLDPDNRQPYSFSFPPTESSVPDHTSESITDDAQKWINLALGIDRTARVLIEYALKQAAINACDDKMKSWLMKSSGIANDEGRQIIIRLLAENENKDGKEDSLDKIQEEQEHYLKRRIEILDSFNNFSDSLRKEFSNELKDIG